MMADAGNDDVPFQHEVRIEIAQQNAGAVQCRGGVIGRCFNGVKRGRRGSVAYQLGGVVGGIKNQCWYEVNVPGGRLIKQ